MSADLVQFEGEPPKVSAGDRVLCRTAFGEWVERTAASGPRYDRANAINRRCYLTVAVKCGDGRTVNWPAEDIRTLGAEQVDTEGAPK